MSSYDALAASYDELMADVEYRRRADALARQFRRSPIPVETVLDLACGTGTIACLLAARGYRVIAVDGSEEMLTQAARKAAALERPPLFLHQSMPQLDLYGTVDAAICCLDSLNYLTRPADVQRTFRRLHLFIAPGGLLVFDINTVAKLAALDGQVFLDETEDAYCVWRAEYSRRRRVCSYFMDIFRLEEESGLWERGEELHEERAYTPEELTSYLRDAGFTQIKQYGNLKHRPPKPGEDRIFFTARKEV